MWLRLSLLLISLSFSLAYGSCPLKDGDLVFIKSQSSQSKLLQLTTGSEWTHVGIAFKQSDVWEIIEAVQPVKWTSLYSFIRRSKNLSFEVKRASFPFDAAKVKAYSESQLDKDYDLLFAWDNNRIYCTELVWKAFNKASGEELGSLEKIGDLQNIDSPAIKAEAKKRFASYGMRYDHEAWKNESVITPIQMKNASNLVDVTKNNMDEYADCLRQ